MYFVDSLDYMVGSHDEVKLPVKTFKGNKASMVELLGNCLGFRLASFLMLATGVEPSIVAIDCGRFVVPCEFEGNLIKLLVLVV